MPTERGRVLHREGDYDGIPGYAAEKQSRNFTPANHRHYRNDDGKGAKASANLYSLVETARANHLEPYAYLRHLFTELPKAQRVADIEALLPWRIDRNSLTL